MTLLLFWILTLSLGTTAQRWMEYEGLWYYFPPEDERQPFYEVQKYCANISSQTVTIAKRDQNNFLMSQIKSESWTGYYHTNDNFCGDTTRFPMWSDDKACSLTFRNSLSGGNETDSYGVAINTDGTWTKRDQAVRLSFICQWQCKKIVVENEQSKPVIMNGIYELKNEFNNDRKIYVNKHSIYLIYYFVSNSKNWLIGPRQDGVDYYYLSRNPIYTYAPDIWNIPNDWRGNVQFYMYCSTCRYIFIDYDDGSGVYNGTYTALTTYDNNEACGGFRSKIYEKKNENSTLYLYVATEDGTEGWYVGSDNCTEGWLLYNTDYTPLPCMSQGLWLDRASTETTTQPTTPPVVNTATTIPETTMLQSTPKTGQTDGSFNIFFIIIPVLGILLIIIIITIIIVCVRKRNEQDEKPPPDIVETSPLPSASQVDEHTNVVKRNGDVGIRNSFQDESIFAQHDELPEKAIKKKTKKK